jgi:hypothetical protein
MGWTAQYFTTIIIEGNSPNTGIFIYSPVPGAGNLIGSWAAQSGTDSFGNNYPAGIFAKAGLLSGVTLNNLCSIAGSPISGSALQGCSYNGGTITETAIVFDSNSGSLVGYATVTSTTTITTSGNFTTPAATTTLTIDGYGAGAGGIYGGNKGGGGGAGEWARDFFTYGPSTVIPVTIGAGGAGGTPSVFAASGGNTNWNSGQLIAHGGSVGGHSFGGQGGTGSSNTLHNDGGRGGNTENIAGCGGGGGGAAGSRGGTGAQGADNSGSGSASGGTGILGGGSGGAGGAGSNGLGTGASGGTVGSAPGGGGGGGGSNVVGNSANGAAGAAGQIVVSFATSTVVVLSVSPTAFTDQFGNAIPAGIAAAHPSLAAPTLLRFRGEATDTTAVGPITSAGAFVVMTKQWSIPANDPIAAGSGYRIRCWGDGTTGTTQNGMDFRANFSGTGLGLIPIGGVEFSAAANPFHFFFEAMIILLAVGSNVGYQSTSRVDLGASTVNEVTINASTQSAGAFVRNGGAVSGLNTTAAMQMWVEFEWVTNTGGPTVTCRGSTLQPIGP